MKLRLRPPAAVQARLPLWLAGVGVLAFLAWLTLLSFGSQWQAGSNGGGHALSKGATGYAGIVQLLRATGSDVAISRQRRTPPGLLVLTPPADVDPKALASLIEQHEGYTLVVLPKWDVMPDQEHKGWVYRSGVLADGPVTLLQDYDSDLKLSVSTAADVGAPLVVGRLRLPAPYRLRSLPPGALPKTWLTNSEGAVVLGCQTQGVCGLADPDLLANHGIANLRRAQSAVAMLNALADGEPIIFDVTLAGVGGGQQNLGTLALSPPFLGVTVLLLLAGLMGLLAGWPRLGLPRLPPPATMPGNAALIEGAAGLIAAARRHRESALRLAGHVLDRAALLARLPPRLDAGQRLAALPGAADHIATIEAARTPQAVLAATNALLDWEKDIANGRR